MLMGLNYMHLQDMCHRDMKPGNILMAFEDDDDQHFIKLTDFGFAIEYDPVKKLEGWLGTRRYIAPEMWKNVKDKNVKYDSKVDIWAAGIIVYNLIFEAQLFDIKDETRGSSILEKQICVDKIDLEGINEDNDNLVSDEAIDFMKKALHRDPKERYSAEQLLHHDWLANIILDDKSENMSCEDDSYIKELQRGSELMEDEVIEVMQGFENFNQFNKLTKSAV